MHFCITSPSYLGLRNYDTPGQVWGVNSTCRHMWLEGEFCQKCNAWIGRTGLEPIPWLHVYHIVEIFREVRKVRRNDETLWLVIGDTYVTSTSIYGIPAKDLIGVPWQVALALRAECNTERMSRIIDGSHLNDDRCDAIGRCTNAPGTQLRIHNSGCFYKSL